MRAWRIHNVDDEFPELMQSINYHLDFPMKFLQQKGLLPFSWNDSEWSKSGAIPLKHRNVSAAWYDIKTLSREGFPPDICFLDIKLKTHKDKDSESDLEGIRLDLLSFIDPELVELFKEDIGRAFQDDPRLGDEKRKIWKRGGFYIMGLIRRLFPRAEIIVYSETHDAIEESVPYQIGNMYFLHPRGKTLLPSSEISDSRITWLYYFDKVLREKLSTGKVSLPKIKKAILELRDSLARLEAISESTYHDVASAQETNLKTTLLNFVGQDIGGAEHKWKIGSFFSFAFQKMSSYGDIFIYDGIMTALTIMESYIDSVEFTPSFARFILEDGGYFDFISHAAQKKKIAPKYHLESSGESIDSLASVLKYHKQDDLLEKMFNAWQQLPCFQNPVTESFTNLLKNIREDVAAAEIQEQIFIDKMKPAAAAKNVLRLRLIDSEDFIDKIIEKAGESCNIGPDKIVTTYGGNSSAYDYKKSNSFPEIAICLPATSFEASSLNILGDLIIATLSCIHEKGFELDSRVAIPEGQAINIDIHIDIAASEYVVAISQKGGKSFQAESLTDAFFFDTTNSFRSELSKVKGWIKIRIKSENKSRDPHAHYDGAWECCELPADVVTQYEFRVALAQN